MNNTELENKVQQWFVDRNLHEANPVKQFLKLMEESGELFEGVALVSKNKDGTGTITLIFEGKII